MYVEKISTQQWLIPMFILFWFRKFSYIRNLFMCLIFIFVGQGYSQKHFNTKICYHMQNLYDLHYGYVLLYSRKVWRVESLANLANCLWFAKLKPSKLVLTINNLLADLLIRQTFFRQIVEKSQFANFYPCQTFPLYGILYYICNIKLYTTPHCILFFTFEYALGHL